MRGRRLNGGAGIRVGFVGAVTEDLPSPSSRRATSTAWPSPASWTRSTTPRSTLKTDGCGGEPCDLVVELVHEGAPSPSCDVIKTDADSTFGRIVARRQRRRRRDRVGPHAPQVQLQGRGAGKTFAERPSGHKRPVVSAGQYGAVPQPARSSTSRPARPTWWASASTCSQMKDYDDDADTKTIVDAAVDRGQPAWHGRARPGRPARSGGPVVRTRPAASWRTAVGSRPWATSSPRSSARRPEPTSADEPRWPARRPDRHRRRLPACR